VACNRGVKFKEILALADKLGASRVATGHYARIVQGAAGLELWRARDASKDQSYFLHMLGQEALARLLLPLGDLDKTQVRSQAVTRELPGALKGESQELCFVSTGRYDAFVAQRAQDRIRPGNIVSEDGQVLGQHSGVHQFTIGQRRNLGVATGQRAYVTGIDGKTGLVQLGSREALLAGGAELEQVALAHDVNLPLSCEVSVRYRGRAVPARVVASEAERAQVQFSEPVQAVVPGQYAVFSRAERVLGGGVIVRALPAALPESARESTQEAHP
jgi:tRNA-specific 2-thiouridylase